MAGANSSLQCGHSNHPARASSVAAAQMPTTAVAMARSSSATRARVGSGKNAASATSAHTATTVTPPQAMDCKRRCLFSAFSRISSIMFSSAFFR